MKVEVEVPDLVADALQGEPGDVALDDQVLEALVIAAYRRGRISFGKVQELLKLPSYWDTEKWMAARGVYLNYSADEYDQDVKQIDEYVAHNQPRPE